MNNIRTLGGIFKPYTLLWRHKFGDNRHAEHAAKVDSFFQAKTEGISDQAKAILLTLLNQKELTEPLPFWNNPFEDGVTICLPALARMSLIDDSLAHQAIDELHHRAIIDIATHPNGNVPIHYGFQDLKSFYGRISSNVTRRYQLPRSIRLLVISVGVCRHCGSTSNLSVDHIVPVKLGGADDVSNLQCLCRPCNSAKRDRFIG